jgi:Domain of unknown function (DUF4129)
MAARDYAEVRPRNLGEILDDGWRLYLAAAPLLLALSGLFLMPAAAMVLLLLTQSGGVLWQPAFCALLLPLTGIGAGACQEAFHLWAEGEDPTLIECLKAAGRRGLNHTLVQLLALLLPTAAVCWLLLSGLPPWAPWLGTLVLFILCLPVWLLGIGRQAVLAAGQKSPWRAWRRSARASGRHPLKATVVVASRLVLLVFAVLNLHLFGRWALWAAEALGGFDVALLQLLCSLANPLYLIALLALAWWLLTPYFEAVNYLFFIDDRTRYEGLDLWYRVDDAFPQLPRKAGVALLVLGAALFTVSPIRAQARLGDVRAAHDDIVRISHEVKQADPYPGGARWLPELRNVGKRLDPEGSPQRGRYRWYFQSIDGFEKRERADALTTLDDIARRLAMIGDNLERSARAGGGRSWEQIKALVPPGNDKPTENRAEKPKPPPREEKPIEKDEPGDFRPAPRGGAVLGGPVGLGGIGPMVLFVLVVLVAAVLVIGVALAIRQWLQNRPPAIVRREGRIEAGGDEIELEPERQDVASLWRQSDDLARSGRFLEAVRTLYLAVLALLHQASLIRFERTRTNGEYADQLRPLKSLHAPFLRLTDLFEVKWYGERRCQEVDYTACRGYAESIRLESKVMRNGEN